VTPDDPHLIPSWAIAEAWRRLEAARIEAETEREERARRWRERVAKIKAALGAPLHLTRGE